jgi:hypothetical protein
MHASDGFPTLFEEGKETRGAPRYAIPSRKHFMGDWITALGHQKRVMSRLAQQRGFSVHFGEPC